VLALLAFPDQFARLRDDPALIGPAVEECLRYDGPSVSVARVAVAELEIGGAHIRPGQRVLPLLGAANRDPAHFSDPHRLDIERRQNAHLSFGAGMHYCVGAPLARLEAAIALSAIAERLPGLRAAPEPATWHEHPSFRLLDSLPVEWEPTDRRAPAIIAAATGPFDSRWRARLIALRARVVVFRSDARIERPCRCRNTEYGIRTMTCIMGSRPPPTDRGLFPDAREPSRLRAGEPDRGGSLWGTGPANVRVLTANETEAASPGWRGASAPGRDREQLPGSRRCG
jgi:hypothetical protein